MEKISRFESTDQIFRQEEGGFPAVSIQGRDGVKCPVIKHRDLVNRGTHTIQAGGRYDSHLLVPVTRG